MGKKLPHTPKSQVRSALRRLFLRSRERAKAMKDAGYTCSRCGRKQSKAKGREVAVECHHRQGVGNWSAVIELVMAELLCSPEKMEILCSECHRGEHEID